MYVKRFGGYALSCPYPPRDIRKGLLDTFDPETEVSTHWLHWQAVLDIRLCDDCRKHHGKIYAIGKQPDVEPPLHERCRCAILPMEAIRPGHATKEGKNGADYWIANYGRLPDYYISREEALKLEWRNSKPLAKVAPGKMLFGGIYRNDNGHLPEASGRIWYEADINYYKGRRNGHRLLFSNDGLLFVTYDHGLTYYEIVQEANHENN